MLCVFLHLYPGHSFLSTKAAGANHCQKGRPVGRLVTKSANLVSKSANMLTQIGQPLPKSANLVAKSAN